jgi:hypothetical protein
MRLTPIIAAISLTALVPITASAEDTTGAGARMASEAERAGDRADDKTALAEQWKDGEKMVVRGKKMADRAERNIAGSARDASKYRARADRAAADGQKAEASLAEARRMIEAGARMKAQAEARFPLLPAA